MNACKIVIDAQIEQTYILNMVNTLLCLHSNPILIYPCTKEVLSGVYVCVCVYLQYTMTVANMIYGVKENGKEKSTCIYERKCSL